MHIKSVASYKQRLLSAPVAQNGRNLRESVWPFSGDSLLVRIVRSGQWDAGGRRGCSPGRGKAARCCPALQRDPLYPSMSQLWVETFRAQTMIMASFGLYLAVSVHDHDLTLSGILVFG